LKVLFGTYGSTGEKRHKCVCGRQGKEEGGREVVCVGCKYVVWDEKSKESRGRPGRKRRLGVDGCQESAGMVPI
jgi:hypothetical protein